MNYINMRNLIDIVNEGTTKRQVDNAFYDLKDMLGADTLLDAIYQALDEDTIESTLKFIIRMYDYGDEIKL